MILCFVLLSAFLSCSKETVDADGNVILTVMIDDSIIVPEEEGTLKDNRWTRYAQEEMLKKGIKVEFVPKSSGLVKQVIMMATGTAPDIAWTDGRLLFSKFAMDGGLQDLGPYLDEYGPNIKEVLGNDVLSYGVLDGVQYAIPSKRGDLGKSTSLIRKDWLDELGMDVPTNRDELVVVLKAFKEKDPGGIGAENVIPWGMVSPDPGTFFEPDFNQFDVMYSFLDHDLEKNATVSWPLREGIKEFLLWMKDLYDMGLIDREFATLNEADNNRKIINGQVGFIHYPTWILYRQSSEQALYNIYKDGSDIEYIPVEVFRNDRGEYRKVLNNPINNYNFVPAKSEVPEAAVTYLNWLLEDETRVLFNYGIEGEHHEMVEGVPVVKDLVHNKETFNDIIWAMKLLGDNPLDEKTYNVFQMQNREIDFDGQEEIAREIHNREGFAQPLYQESLPVAAKNGMGLIKICEKYWVKLITEDNFEEDFAEFIEKLHDRNIDLIDEEKAEYYERHN